MANSIGGPRLKSKPWSEQRPIQRKHAQDYSRVANSSSSKRLEEWQVKFNGQECAAFKRSGGDAVVLADFKCPERRPEAEERRHVLDGHNAGRQEAPGGRSLDCWSDAIWMPCKDGKSRRIPAEPEFFPLANGPSSDRFGWLKAVGNAIVPQVAVAFIQSVMEKLDEK